MARTTKTSRKIASAARRILKSSRKSVLSDICVNMEAAAKNNNNKVPYGYVTKLLKELSHQNEMQWLTKSVINKAFMKYRADVKKGLVPNTIHAVTSKNDSVSEISGNDTAVVSNSEGSASCNGSKKSKGGRPNGTTDASKKSKELMLFQKKNDIARKFSKLMKSKKGRLKKGTLMKLIEDET